MQTGTAPTYTSVARNKRAKPASHSLRGLEAGEGVCVFPVVRGGVCGSLQEPASQPLGSNCTRIGPVDSGLETSMGTRQHGILPTATWPSASLGRDRHQRPAAKRE